MSLVLSLVFLSLRAGHRQVPFYFGGSGRPTLGASQVARYQCPDPVPTRPGRGQSPYELRPAAQKTALNCVNPSGQSGTPPGTGRKKPGTGGTPCPEARPAGRPRSPGTRSRPRASPARAGSISVCDAPGGAKLGSELRQSIGTGRDKPGTGQAGRPRPPGTSVPTPNHPLLGPLLGRSSHRSRRRQLAPGRAQSFSLCRLTP